MSTSEQQMQQLVDQVQMLTAELAAQRLELDAAKNALDQQTQTATAALSVAQAAIAQIGKTETQKKTLNPKLVNPPDPFQGTDADWERYKFGFATWISTVDPTYPDLLRKAELERDEVATVEMTEADEQLSTKLFAILVGQCQAGEIPAMAMLVPERNDLELWRRMHARLEPENKHKPSAWLRALSNPTFPTKETLWQRGLEEWKGEIAKYEREYTKQFDEDLKLAILSEVAPKALAPQIAMNSSNLTSYKLMREFIVQYLKSKNLWKRSAGTSLDPWPHRRHHPLRTPLGQFPWRLVHWMLRTLQQSKKESQQDTKEIKTVKVETKEEQKVMGKARTRAEESKTQANRMRKASIARFAVQRKVKTTVQKIVSSTPGRTRKVKAKETRKDPPNPTP